VPEEEIQAARAFMNGVHVEREVPMKRKGIAEEQASAIVFFASEDASFISGQILPVGGGATYPF